MAGFADIVQLPGLDGIADTIGLKSSVRGKDVVVGALLSLAGIFGTKWLINRFAADKIPAMVMRFHPALAGLVTGLVIPKLVKGPAAKGYALGAVAGGLAINAIQELKMKFPMLADVVDLRLAGMIVEDPALNGYGLTVDEPARQLQALGSLDMHLGDEFGLEDELGSLLNVG